MTPDDYKELLTKVKSKRERTASRGIVFTEKSLVLPEFNLQQGLMRDVLESKIK